MSRVVEGVYIGSRDEASNKDWLDQHNITHILNASKEVPNYFTEKYKYIKLGLSDHPKQSIKHVLTPSIYFVRDAIRNDGNILIHCHAGVSRSATIVIYTLMHTMKWSFDKAYDFLKRKHPRANPNAGFVRQLHQIKSL